MPRKDKMKITKTDRGFDIISFEDIYKRKCSIQKSSLATEDAIWIGVDDADPQILASKIKLGGTGWVKYDMPDDVTFITRMHLNRALAEKILPILERFVETGEIA